MPVESFIIKPILGLKSDVPQNDPSLFQYYAENRAAVYAVGGIEFDLRRMRNAASKAYGRSVWSASTPPMKRQDTPSNLVTNGADWTGASGATPPTGWDVVASHVGTHSIVSDALKLEVNSDANPAITQDIAVTLNKFYELRFDYQKDANADEVNICVGTTAGGTDILNVTGLTATSSTTLHRWFRATSATIYVTLKVIASTATYFAYFDDLELYILETPSTIYCLGTKECTTGAGGDHRWAFFGNDASLGQIFRYDDNKYPIRISDVEGHKAATEFAYNAADYYSVLDFGGYMIFSDFGEHTAYKADVDDTVLTKLIQSGTEYYFRYLEAFQGRIIGAYDTTPNPNDDVNGDISIRWTSNLITADPWSSLTIASANQLYRPNDDPITGMRKMGRNALYLYGANSIDRFDYYPGYSTVFGFTNMVTSGGTTSSGSIIDIGDRHYFFDKNYGFCEYRGGTEYPFGGRPISEAIEKEIGGIEPTYYSHIVGKHIRNEDLLIWAVPTEGFTYPNKAFIYDKKTGNWVITEIQVGKAYDHWQIINSLTWNDLSDPSGIGTYDYTWETYALERWTYAITSQGFYLVFSNNDGKIYYRATEADNDQDFAGYRIEPVLDFASPNDKDLLLEVWFGIVTPGDYNILLWHRGGDTLSECINEGWSNVYTVSANNPSEAVIYINEDAARFHQIKWGTTAKNEPFQIEQIEFKYVRQGKY